MEELKWVDNIIVGMNTPDISGYAIVEDGAVVSFPIPSEFNNFIKNNLLPMLSIVTALKAQLEDLREGYYERGAIIAELREENAKLVTRANKRRGGLK